MAMLVSPVATTLIARTNTRTTLLVGVFFETLSLIGASFAKQTWQLFLSQGVCFGWGMGFLFVGSVSVPPQWFTSKRSLANACGAAGSGLGGVSPSPIPYLILPNRKAVVHVQQALHLRGKQDCSLHI